MSASDDVSGIRGRLTSGNCQFEPPRGGSLRLGLARLRRSSRPLAGGDPPAFAYPPDSWSTGFSSAAPVVEATAGSALSAVSKSRFKDRHSRRVAVRRWVSSLNGRKMRRPGRRSGRSSGG